MNSISPTRAAAPSRRRPHSARSLWLLPCLVLPLAFTVSGCGGKEPDTAAAPEAPAKKDADQLRSDAFPEVGGLVYGQAGLQAPDPVRLRRMRYRERNRKSDVAYDLKIDDSDPVATRMIRRHVEREQAGEGGAATYQVDKTVIYGLRGLIKFYDRHTRKDQSGVVDDWVNRVTRIYRVEGSLFPIDFAKELRIEFDSETEDLKTGKRTPMTNEYLLTVKAVLEAPEFLERMPFDDFRKTVTGRVYAIELVWTFGAEGREKTDHTRTLFYSDDLGFVVPCCQTDTTSFSELELAA